LTSARAIDGNRLLRGVFWARLAVAGLLLPLGSLLPDEMMPGTNHAILAVSLATVAILRSSRPWSRRPAAPARCSPFSTSCW
jgi:hypothetical protein